MKKPGGLVGVVGTPAITGIISVAACFCLYAWYLDSDAAILGVGALAVMAWTMRANAKVAEYTAWKRAWDSLAPGEAPRPSSNAPPLKIAIAVAVIGALIFLRANGDQPGNGVALAWLFNGVVALVVWLAVRRFRSTARPIWAPAQDRHRPDAVTVCVTGAVVPVPPLKGAYDALPAHCWRALDAR